MHSPALVSQIRTYVHTTGATWSTKLFKLKVIQFRSHWSWQFHKQGGVGQCQYATKLPSTYRWKGRKHDPGFQAFYCADVVYPREVKCQSDAILMRLRQSQHSTSRAILQYLFKILDTGFRCILWTIIDFWKSVCCTREPSSLASCITRLTLPGERNCVAS
jgi:hypothetical protein